MTNNLCIVVFPVYKPLSVLDRECFEQAIRMTPGFKHVFIAPESFIADESFDSLRYLEFIYFDDFYFKGIQGYNSLMMSKRFYRRFLDYEYMLIHQSDAYLFKPELEYWCKKGYDYIGAPWYRPYITREEKAKKLKAQLFSIFYSEEKNDFKKIHLLYNNVGNGGLSLRRISTFLKVLEKASFRILEKYIQRHGSEFNEDVFWSLEASKIYSKFRKPNCKTALHFSFELYPVESFAQNRKILPFGCHAFNIYGTDFWESYIPPLKFNKLI